MVAVTVMRCCCTLAVVGLAGVGLFAGVGTPARAGGSIASGCISSGAPKPPRIIFVGVALSRPGGEAAGGVLFAPADFRVIRYLRGRGPKLVRVMTGLTWNGRDAQNPPNGLGSDGFYPRAGQRWRIAVDHASKSGVYFMAPCDTGFLLK
jgi:hypothetical protein